MGEQWRGSLHTPPLEPLLGFRIYLFAERNVRLVNALFSHVPGVKSEEGRRDRREGGVAWGKGKLYSGGFEGCQLESRKKSSTKC